MDVAYGTGWDPAAKRLLGAMTTAEARSLDERGDQYSTLFLYSGRPRFVADVCWRGWYFAVWQLDDELRRERKYGYRLLDGRLFANEVQIWRYRPDHVEFDPRAWHQTIDIGLDGRTYESTDHGRGHGASTGWHQLDVDHLWQPLRPFGEWRPVEEDGVDEPVPPGLTESFLSASRGTPDPPWHPPTPLQPADFEGWFTDGARFDVPNGPPCTIRLRTAGPLRLTTGHLVAAEAGPFNNLSVPFVETVPPGRYPVTLAGMAWDKPGSPTYDPAAVRLDIRDEPVASWALALRPDQDARLLGDDEAYGFLVDGGTGALFDAAAAGLAHVTEWDPDGPLSRLNDLGCVELAGSPEDANVLAFTCPMGDGAYPTWIGRTAAGDIACFLVDLEILRDARRVLP